MGSERDLRVVCVARSLGAFAVGRLLNAKTTRFGAPADMSANLADYLVPVDADVGVVEAYLVPEEDPHVNPIGAKGVGEIGITGVAAAIIGGQMRS